MTEPNKPKDEKLTMEDYEHLLDKYQFSQQEAAPGKIVKGRVLKITADQVMVDIGMKSEGMIPITDFTDSADPAVPAPGQEVEAVLERNDRKEGYFILSKKKADAEKALDALEKAAQHGGFVTGKIVDRAKNGYQVNVGIPAFMPESHADIRPVRDPESLIGQTGKFKVIRFDRKTENAVVSRKMVLADEREIKKRKVFSTIEKGQKLPGHIRSLTNFGAFVDIGGVEGLLHVSDISWGKIGHPQDVLQPGQDIEVVVLDFNEKDEKISLGLKQLTPDPWSNIAEKFKAGDKITGKVTSLTDFGAFVELEKGVEGLVHISDLTWSRKMIHPKKLLKLGDMVTVSILEVNPTSKRISLGLKQALPHPLEGFKERHNPGTRVHGKITSITDFGAFLEVEPGIEGLIHISDISWEKIKHPSVKLKVGQETDAVVLGVDVDRQKVSLGIKQLEGDIWEDFFARQKVGDMVNVKIVRIADFGVFVEILPGIEGVVFNSEIDEHKVENPADVVKINEEKQAKIIKLNSKDKKISLSFRQAQADIQKQDYQRYQDNQGERLTFGDLIREQLNKSLAAKTAAPAAVKEEEVRPQEPEETG
ncbi:MAG: 30S ribosomal protein S1, partial [Acidobacteriota bacterium]|nr:30S ribosomal protein S1 [Acidobacteriota bacterium]